MLFGIKWHENYSGQILSQKVYLKTSKFFIRHIHTWTVRKNPKNPKKVQFREGYNQSFFFNVFRWSRPGGACGSVKIKKKSQNVDSLWGNRAITHCLLLVLYLITIEQIWCTPSARVPYFARHLYQKLLYSYAIK